MSKVGILSMQRIANYGSFLQAYGLKKMLEDIGCEVQFVDYHPGKTLIPSEEGVGMKRKICKVLETLTYNVSLKNKVRFIKYKKNYATNYYPYLGINEEKNYSPELDVLIIGSDEVFNCVQNNTNVGFSPELFGVGSNAKRLITYAASFGNTTEEKLIEFNIAEKIGDWLNRFDAISVRDNNSAQIIKAISDIQPQYHLDPVLAYDFIGKCKKICIEKPKSKYMILYGYSGRFNAEECGKIRSYAKKRGLKIFCIGGVQHACDEFIDCNPFQVLAYFQNAECVVTDTFHGTIMSIITHRRFVTFIRKTGYGNYEKIMDLAIRLGVKNQVIESVLEFEEKIEMPIDYKAIDNIIFNERKKSYEYLESEISHGYKNY